jgi:hypothetical protein
MIDDESVTQPAPNSRRETAGGDQFFYGPDRIGRIAERHAWARGWLANLRARNHNCRVLESPAPTLSNESPEQARMAQQELSETERAELRRQIERLREEHRDLDAAIEALNNAGAADRLQMQRIKKRKLALRDRLAQLEDLSTPDIIA